MVGKPEPKKDAQGSTPDLAASPLAAEAEHRVTPKDATAREFYTWEPGD